jgi:hypothetical protein
LLVTTIIADDVDEVESKVEGDVVLVTVEEEYV